MKTALRLIGLALLAIVWALGFAFVWAMGTGALLRSPQNPAPQPSPVVVVIAVLSYVLVAALLMRKRES